MINSRSIIDLHSTLQRGANEFIRRMALKNYQVLITATYRDNEYQNSLYEQGRTKPGSIVTNAKGGQSMHNYKLAFDICKNVKGHEYDDNLFFSIAGKIWVEMGGEWGGNWTSPDNPHFQFTDGAKDSDIFNGKKVVSENCKMTWENKNVEERIYLITRLELIKNNKLITTSNIFFEGKNYVELRDYEESYGNIVTYNNQTKQIIVKEV